MATEANNTRNKAVYSNGDLTSYDNVATAMAVRFFNQTGAIDFSPISPDKVNTDKFEKGMYDHENRMSVYVNGTAASKWLAAIKVLQENPELRSTSVEFGKDRKVTFFNPATVSLKIAGQKIDTSKNFVISVKVASEDTPITLIHVLQNTDVEVENTKKKTSIVTINSGLDNLKTFLTEVISLATGSYRQGAMLGSPRGNSGGASAQQKSKSFAATFDEDENNSDEELHQAWDEAADTNKSKGKKANSKDLLATKGKGKKASKKSSLEEEFNGV